MAPKKRQIRLRKPTSSRRKSARPKPAKAPRRAPRTQSNRKAAAASSRKLATSSAKTGRKLVVELWGITRELVRIPVALYMRLAEWLGARVLRAWLAVWPVFVAFWALAKRVLAWGQREVTPARATLAVAAVTAVALVGSQFVDYRTITIGSSAYENVADVAPPPPVESDSAGSAHAWAGVPLGVIAALIVLGCALGRWRLARVLIPIGLAAVAISVFIDRPKGLDEGNAAVAYEGAKATLLGGFWAQLVAGVLLVLLAPLLTRALRPRASAEPGETPVRSQRGDRKLALPKLKRPRLRGRRVAGEAP